MSETTKLESTPMSGFLHIYSITNDDVPSMMNVQSNINSASVYNTADGFETNPEIIRSEMMFYTTPSTEKYTDAAYDSLVNIQNQCAYDYQNYCLHVQSEQISLNDVMNQMFPYVFPTNSFSSFHRNLNSMEVIANDSFKSGAEYVNYIRNLITNKLNFLSFMKNPYTSAVFRPSDKTDNKVTQTIEGNSLVNKLKLFRNSKLSDQKKLSNIPRIHSNYHIQKEANPLSSTQERHLSGGVPAKIAHMRPAPEWGSSVNAIKRALLFKNPTNNNEQRRAAPGWVNPTTASTGTTSNSVDTSHINPVLVPAKIAHMRPAPEWDSSIANTMKHTLVSPVKNNEQRRAAPGWVNPATSSTGTTTTTTEVSPLNKNQKRRIAEESIIETRPAEEISSVDVDSKVGCGGKRSDYNAALLIETVDNDDDYYQNDDEYYQNDDDNVDVVDDDDDDLNMWVSSFNTALIPQFNSDRLSVVDLPKQDSSHDHQDWHHHHGGGDDQRDVSSSSSSSSSSSEGFGDEHSWWGLPPHPPPPPPSSEDLTFAGSLGFGAEGDMCLYRNMDQLSSPCVSAISDFYQLREEYWDEYQHQQAPCHGKFGFIVIALLCIVLLVRRYFGHKRRQQVRSLLTALHTHPELKATVEAETGLKVPMPVPDSCCNTSSSSTSCPLSKCKGFMIRTVKVLLFFTFLVISSLFITISSLELTMLIVQQMDKVAQQDPITGELYLTSPLAALCILFAIVGVQVSLLVVAIRAIKKCCPCPYKNNKKSSVPTATTTPSAPSYEEQGSMYNGVRTASQSRSFLNSAQYYFTTLPASLFTTSSNNNNTSLSDAYTPLLTNEDRVEELNSSEMISISSKPPILKQQQGATMTMMIPITARPVNSISMV